MNGASRTERSTRSNNKVLSPQDSIAQSLDSIEETDRHTRGELTTTRRSKRGNTNDKDGRTKKIQGREDDEEEQLEEITRCLCGYSDYPGPSTLSEATTGQPGGRTANKEENAQKTVLSIESPSEDAGNFFIQCDSCQVWQHGGCVGLMDESMSPDEYFCEACKPEYHRSYKHASGYVYFRGLFLYFVSP